MICGVWDGWKVFNSLMQLFLSILISRSFTFSHTQFEACTQQIMSAFPECDCSVQQNCSNLLLQNDVCQFPLHSLPFHLHLNFHGGGLHATDRLFYAKQKIFTCSVKTKRENEATQCQSCQLASHPHQPRLVVYLQDPFFCKLFHKTWEDLQRKVD